MRWFGSPAVLTSSSFRHQIAIEEMIVAEDGLQGVNHFETWIG